jgi:hypothetical protein
VLVRISGLAFVLHQIRHMIGTALAVVNGVVPRDVVPIALGTPLRVDISPLVPGCGLVLDRIDWFDVKEGKYEARLPTSAREEMERFKREVIYPHVHDLYADGSYEQFLGELRQGNFTKGHAPADYEQLRRVHTSWSSHVSALAMAKREERAARRAEALQSEQEPPLEQDGTENAQTRRSRRPKRRELPGGMLVNICVARQLLPGLETDRALSLLKQKVAQNELLPAQTYEYYLAELDRVMPANKVADHFDF